MEMKVDAMLKTQDKKPCYKQQSRHNNLLPYKNAIMHKKTNEYISNFYITQKIYKINPGL